MQDKNKEIHNLQLQLRNKSLECDQLRSDINHTGVNRADMDKVISAATELQDDNNELVLAITARNLDISELEAEIEKVDRINTKAYQCINSFFLCCSWFLI